MDANASGFLPDSGTSLSSTSSDGGTGLDGATARLNILPIELLTMIFTEVALSQESFNMPLRSVCRLWLHLIDNTPDCWTRIKLERPGVDLDRLCVVLQRSKTRPIELAVYMKALKSVSMRLASILLPEIGRARSLDLCHDVWDNSLLTGMSKSGQREERDAMAHWLQQLVMVPAPLLEVLIMVALTVPDDIFLHTTPARLRELYLTDCNISPLACVFKSTELTELTVTNCKGWDTVDEMIAFLGTLPKLRHFMWDSECYFVPFLDPSAFGRRSVRLADLVGFDLFMRMRTLALLLPVLDFPETCRISLEGCFPDVADQNNEDDALAPPALSFIDDLQAVLEPHFKRLFPGESMTPTGIRLSGDVRSTSGIIGVKFELGYTENSTFIYLPDVSFAVSWGHDRQEDRMDIVMRLLGWHGMVANIQSVNVKDVWNGFLDEAQQWTRLLQWLPNVAKLTVRGECAGAAFDALCANATPSSQFATALKRVVIHCANAVAIARIIDALDRRASACLPRLNLNLRGCEIEAAGFERLKQHEGVGVAKWDGKVFDGSQSSQQQLRAELEAYQQQRQAELEALLEEEEEEEVGEEEEDEEDEEEDEDEEEG